jgi:hypothetical protein
MFVLSENTAGYIFFAGSKAFWTYLFVLVLESVTAESAFIIHSIAALS